MLPQCFYLISNTVHWVGEATHLLSMQWWTNARKIWILDPVFSNLSKAAESATTNNIYSKAMFYVSNHILNLNAPPVIQKGSIYFELWLSMTDENNINNTFNNFLTITNISEIYILRTAPAQEYH